MIDDVRLVYASSAPDLCSPSYAALLHQVTGVQSWVRWAMLIIGCGLALLAVWILSHGRLTPAGYVAAGILSLAATSGLLFWWGLQRDVAPYRLTNDELCRYQLREGVITKFGNLTSFGSSRSRFERIYWKLIGEPVTGRTPYVRAIMSAFLDLDDVVYIGTDPTGANPPIFLGAKKPVPEVLVRQPPASVREMYAALDAYMKTSRRWKGRRLLTPFGLDASK